MTDEELRMIEASKAIADFATKERESAVREFIQNAVAKAYKDAALDNHLRDMFREMFNKDLEGRDKIEPAPHEPPADYGEDGLAGCPICKKLFCVYDKRGIMPKPAAPAAKPKLRTCNMHNDCDAANAKAAEKGRFFRGSLP